MAEDYFEAVTIETNRPGKYEKITNIRQVRTRLTDRWPATHKGAAYRKAVKACVDYLKGKKEVEAVRSSFIAAAKEAGIFVRDKRLIH